MVYWTEDEFDLPEGTLMQAAMQALLHDRVNGEAERDRYMEIISAKRRGGPRSNQPPRRQPVWIGRFAVEDDGVYRIIPGSENQPPR